MVKYKKVKKISSEISNNFYIFNKRKLVKNYNDFRNAFKKYYKNTRIAYAYKANYAPFVVKTINKVGGLSEVVSNMEYDIAIKCGVDPSQIIFNGPVKTQNDIKTAIENNSIINIDSLYELDIIDNLTKSYESFRKIKKKIGFRVNFALPNKSISRFGLNESQMNSAIKRIKKINNCNINGLHCHFSTRDKNPENYKYITNKMISLSKNLINSNKLEYLDIGGGFFGNIPDSLKNNFTGKIYQKNEYASAIAGEFSEQYGDNGPTLIIEPGISLVGDTMKYYTKVIDIKKIRGNYIALTSGSINHIKPANRESYQPFDLIRKLQNEVVFTKKYDIVGNTCMENDILHKGYKGKINKGDFLVFPNKGAYTNVFAPPFIHYTPPILEITNNGINILRREQNNEDILSSYNL